jgi:transposase
MESMGKKPRRRRSFTPEFKAEIVGLCRQGDRSIGQVARDFDLTETAVREWVKQAERDSGAREDGGLASTERQELKLFHPAYASRVCNTWMALASCPARQGQQRSLRRMRQVLSWAFARSPGARSPAWARFACGCRLFIRAGQAACRYSWRVLPSRSRRRTWERRKVAQVVCARPVAGSTPCSLRISQTVEAAILMPRAVSSPWILL